MTIVFIVFWTCVVFGSIAWYGFLLFYVAFKGFGDLKRMTAALSQDQEDSTNRAAPDQK